MVKNNSQTGAAYTIVRDKILSYELAPGMTISDHKFASMLEMSRAPVREAILLLVADGLIEHNANGKYCVSDLGYQDIMDIFDVRRALEREAVGIIARNGWLNQEQLNELKQYMNTFQVSKQSDVIFKSNQTDEGFHTTIIQFSGNGRMLQMIEKINLQMLRARWINMVAPARQPQVPAEHQTIYEALQAQDLPAAEAAVCAHLNNSMEIFREVFTNPAFKHLMAGIRNFFEEGMEEAPSTEC